MKNFLNFSLLIGLMAFSSVLFAQQTTVVSIQGTLKDANGTSVSDGDRSVVFKLYDALTNGNLLWEETATVTVVGGIYSHNLGSVTPLVAGDFDQTLYLGVVVGSLELSPRTQMTYAPYALAVNSAQRIAQQGCSGQVGDVKYSILNPTQFAQENGDCWVPMDGRAIPGTALAAYGHANVPDMSGLFIRATEYNDGNDPGRAPMATTTLQGDDNKNHLHTVNITTTTNGSHTHTYSDHHQIVNSGGFSDGGAANEDDKHATTTTRTTNGAGNHSHQVSGNTGLNGTESRPKNMNFYIYIRVD